MNKGKILLIAIVDFAIAAIMFFAIGFCSGRTYEKEHPGATVSLFPLASVAFADDTVEHRGECNGEWTCVKSGEVVVGGEVIIELETQIGNLENELEGVQFELTTAQSRLEATELELETAQMQLEMAQADLKTTREDLKSTTKDLMTAYEDLDGKVDEIKALEDKLTLCLARPPGVVKGLWVGAYTGYPFGVMGSAGFQFNERFMANSAIGYMDGFIWQIGFSTRIKEW